MTRREEGLVALAGDGDVAARDAAEEHHGRALGVGGVDDLKRERC